MTRIIWQGANDRVNPTVLKTTEGGLIFRYDVPFHGDGTCEFTLWCQVGEVYKKYFRDFWQHHKLSDKSLEVHGAPYIYDTLEY